jgi:soluble lytic murein transglycosylase-like protein
MTLNGQQSIEVAGSRPKLDASQRLKLQKAVREFESIFVGYMVKSMRNTVEKADNSTDSFGTDMLEGLFDVELAKHISRNSNLGLAEMLYRKITGESLAEAQRMAATARVPLPASERRTTSEAPGAQRGNSPLPREGMPKTFQERLRVYDTYIAEAAEQFGVRDSLIRAVIAAESGGRPDARSAKEAKGLMQLIDSTAQAMGVQNVWDPRENILGGAKYLKQLLDHFGGDERLALASYNAGPAAVQRYGGVPPYRETQEYVRRVLNFVEMIEHEEDDHE